MNYLPNQNLREAILTIEQVIWLMDTGKVRFVLHPGNGKCDFIRVKKFSETTIGIQREENEEDYFNNLPQIAVEEADSFITFDKIKEYLLPTTQCPDQLRNNQVKYGSRYTNFREKAVEEM